MPHSQATLQVLQEPGVLVVRVKGAANMHQCPAILKLAQESRAAGIPACYFDLHECVYMDSTFMGTLVRLKRDLMETFGLIAPSPQCVQLLKQMGLDGLLTVVESPVHGNDSQWRELDTSGKDPSAFKESVVRAHQELAAIPGEGERQFKALAAQFAKAWEAEKNSAPN